MENLFMAESLIISRLRDTLSVEEVPTILNLADLDALEERKKQAVTPAIYVAYAGETPGASAVQGKYQEVLQRWLVVIVVQSMYQQSGSDSKSKAGPIAFKVHQSLSGYALAPNFKPCVRLSAPIPSYGKGYWEFPMLFQTPFVLRGAVNG